MLGVVVEFIYGLDGEGACLLMFYFRCCNFVSKQRKNKISHQLNQIPRNIVY